MSTFIFIGAARQQLRRSVVHRTRNQYVFATTRSRSNASPASLSRHVSTSGSRLSTGSPLPPGPWNISGLGVLLYGLVGLGIASTSYGLYQHYSVFSMWPKEVRSSLRAGMKAKRNGDYEKSAEHFVRALQTLCTLIIANPPSEVEVDDVILKATAIIVATADSCEVGQHMEQAYKVYEVGFGIASSLVSRDALIRSVAIANKLAELAEARGLPEKEREKWLAHAVSGVFSVVKIDLAQQQQELQQQKDQQHGFPEGHEGKSESVFDKPFRQNVISLEIQKTLRDLEVPAWANAVDFTVPFEALGDIWAKNGEIHVAKSLYELVLTGLVPSNRTKLSRVPPESLCRGARVASNLAELSLHPTPTPEARQSAQKGAEFAQSMLEVAEKVLETTGASTDIPACNIARVAILSNLGSLAEMAGEWTASREYFLKSLGEARRVGMQESIKDAEAALRRLDDARKSGTTPSLPTEPDSLTQ